jgi:hypothetical protein
MSQSKKKRASYRKPAVPAWLVLLGIVLFGVIALFAWSAAYDNAQRQNAIPIDANGRAKFVAQPARIDMGDVKLGQMVRAEFEIGNAGDQPLSFTQVPIIQVVEGC